MKTRTIAIALGAMLLTLVGVVAAGAAIDASDGSIDAFDDQKWEATGNDGKIESGDAAYNGSLAAQRDAYDYGVALYEDDSSVCTAMTQGHDQAVSLMNVGTDATSLLTELQTFTNDWVTDRATAAGISPSDSPYALSGLWDELARDCPQALFEPKIAGRP